MFQNDPSFFPIMGEILNEYNAMSLDMSAGNTALQQLDLMDSEAFSAYIQQILTQKKRKYALGGYGENRSIYQRSPVFAQADAGYRNIHLGVDIWSEAGTAVYSPLEGRLHSYNDNEGFGNYGPTLIMEHHLKDETIYALYGHLSRKDLNQLYPGKVFLAGERIGHLGKVMENGHWPPHLHFQLIRDLANWQGDYPGVCEEKDIEKYLNNCPDPNSWLGLPVLSS
ncbi:Peptidase family M23 [Cyclobacterium lianum]|uniref:Peptidase family M23 n=1 Tax=Cyclobacterium lianum TaxID=388280 RepID=A0A1M7K4B2_9BACT|nr:peptidoglycan DD-metalloendopeptidase family protein [Cyclobacterium lianum]SHM60088.1 Peptidase family M23 [Cyclobacterium lianum]